MASYVNLSLEDIITKKKQKPKKPGKNIKPKSQTIKKKLAVTDARNKIISKKRTQITDAREKLEEIARQKDARHKLEQLRQNRLSKNQKQSKPLHLSKFNRIIHQKERVFTDASRQVVSQPIGIDRSTANFIPRQQIITKKFTDKRSIETRNLRKYPIKPIVRTIENDIELIDDPMGDDYMPLTRTHHNRKTSLQLKIIAHNNDVREQRSSAVYRTAVTERERSPPRPPSILKKRPMAALRSEKTPDKPSVEYRIIVSNLQNSVTGGDIQELFGDVGGMVESRLVRPGTAEVMYKTLEDAQRAVDLYHNRQLDGQPMNCLLVTPRTNSTPAKSPGIPALYSTNSNVEPDISTFHKVLFSNF